MAKYDVFLSCKSEDYKYAEEVYDFLRDNGIHVFLASKELRKMGESEYRRAISKAMKDAYHLIVFASNPEYVDSAWVYYEWDMFINAKLKGFKPGNIITILKGVTTDEINMDLWKYESMPFESYKNIILQYVETEESKIRREEMKKKEETERLKRLKEEQEERRVKKLKEKLSEIAENYKKQLSALSVDVDKMYNILKSIGVTTRVCPICRQNNDLDMKSCQQCGWPLSPTEGIPGLEYLYSEKDKPTKIFKSIFEDFQDNLKDLPSIKSLEKENAKLLAENESMKTNLERLHQEVEKGNKRASEESSSSQNGQSPSNDYKVSESKDYGIEIRLESLHDLSKWWEIASEASKLIAIFCGGSITEYRKELQHGVLTTPRNMKISEAEILSAKINNLGALSKVVHI